ncbi:MAG: DNA polymerase III subunit alpha, partial [Planktomarina sp.]
ANGAENEINAIPLDDKASYKLYSAGKTVAVFQVESSGMIDALKRMKPDCIEDIVALVALYRPGPMENIPKFCEVKNGISERDLLHPSVDHILDETQGIIVYQEQVMEIARQMAGYSLGGADLLRRAMGKKIQEAMDAEKPKFLKGSADNDVDEATAKATWDLLDKFANYGFNKSHAAAYAVVSYQTAWLKANHPVEFMAGVMNCDLHLTEKLAVYFTEVKKGLKLPYTPPCVNRSQATFDVENGTLIYALGALKGVGVDAMGLVVSGRGDKEFVNLFDFARRVDLKRVGKRALEMMARAGAFDVLEKNRRRVFQALDRLSAYSAAVHEQRASSQVSLFGEAGDDLPEPRLDPVDDWQPAERLSEEFTAIGFYLSGHPLDDYLPSLKRQGILTLDQIEEKAQSGPCVVKMAGTVASRQERKSARGNRFAFIQLSDTTGAYEVTMFSDALEISRDHLETGAKVVVQVEATMESDQLKLLARSAVPMDGLVEQGSSAGLRVYVDDLSAIQSAANVLAGAAKAAKSAAKGPISFCLMDASLPGEVDIDAGTDFPVTPQIKGALKSLDGVVMVEEL